MSNDKKEKVGIWMPPDMVKQVDAAYPLHEISSRSEFVCNAVEFYLGFLLSETSQEYVNKTTLSFLETHLSKLEGRICKQLFRMCVEQSMAAHIAAHWNNGVPDDTLKKLRNKCVKDVKSTVGNIRFDGIYAYQHPDMYRSEAEYEQRD